MSWFDNCSSHYPCDLHLPQNSCSFKLPPFSRKTFRRRVFLKIVAYQIMHNQDVSSQYVSIHTYPFRTHGFNTYPFQTWPFTTYPIPCVLIQGTCASRQSRQSGLVGQFGQCLWPRIYAPSLGRFLFDAFAFCSFWRFDMFWCFEKGCARMGRWRW